MERLSYPGFLISCLLILGIAGSSCRQGAISDNSEPIDEKTLKEWSAPYRNWHYYPDLVIPARPDIPGIEGVKMTDVPTVFQVKGRDGWLMSYIGFDGKGYQSFVAESKDLVQWDKHRLAMGFGPEGEFDHGGVVLGAYLYKDYDIKAPPHTEEKKGQLLFPLRILSPSGGL
jgi:hypothetical protein